MVAYGCDDDGRDQGPLGPPRVPGVQLAGLVRVVLNEHTAKEENPQQVVGNVGSAYPYASRVPVEPGSKTVTITVRSGVRSRERPRDERLVGEDEHEAVTLVVIVSAVAVRVVH